MTGSKDDGKDCPLNEENARIDYICDLCIHYNGKNCIHPNISKDSMEMLDMEHKAKNTGVGGF